MYATIYPITPIDPNNGGTIKFAWHGNQAFRNRCIIRDNETNAVVYDHTIETFKFEHTIVISEASLVSGKKYSAYITVFDQSGIESELQQLGTLFYCLTTPIFRFSNISQNQIISSSGFEFLLSYSQVDGELLDSWSITLHSHAQIPIATSGTKYNTDHLAYLFTGFENKKEYYVRGEGRTINGISLDTGLIKISVTYDVREMFSLLEPTNLPDIGAIQIRSNIVSSEGHLQKNGIYINGEYIDLTNNVLTYSEGFILNDPFSLVLCFYGVKPNDQIAELYGENFNIVITYRVGKYDTNSMKGYFELRVISNGITHVQYSNMIDLPTEKALIGLCLIRQNEFYHIFINNLGEVTI